MNRKQMRFLLALSLVAAFPLCVADAAEPRLEWSFETGGKIYASPILADLDGDGKTEVIVAASRDKRLICLDWQGELLWDYRIDDGHEDGLQATPSAIDYDGDGKQEVFFASEGGVIGCLDFQGRLIWRTFTYDRIDYSGPVLADVDGDGRIEVVVGSDSGTLYCLDDCGMERWHYAHGDANGGGAIRGIPAIALEPESKTRRIYVTFGGGAEVCINSEGKLVWAHREPSPRLERRSSPAVGDVDSDGAFEVISATEDFQVIVRDAFTGEEEWRWAGNAGIDQTNNFALVSFDGSAQFDIVCADGTGQGGQGHVHRLRNGEALWSTDVGGGVVQGPSVGDVDGDGQLEILVCSRSKRLVCLSENGEEEWAYPSQAGVLTTPALGDIDGDGVVEIVFTGKDHFVYCVTVDGAYDERKMPWPTVGHDPQLTNNTYGALYTPPAVSPYVNMPDLQYEPFGPVHVGRNVFEVRALNKSWRPRHLEAVAQILLPTGNIINRTITDRFEPIEARAITLEFPALYEGTYALGMRLVDVGAGRTIAREETTAELDLETYIDLELHKTFLGGPETLAKTPAGPAKTRLEEAADRLRQEWEAASAELRHVVASEDAGPKERRDAVAAAHAVGREASRLYARTHAITLMAGPVGEFAVLPDNTMHKVFKDEPYLKPYLGNEREPRTAEIALARNEYEGLQLVVVPLLKDLKNLRVALVGDLTQESGPGRIPREAVTLNRIGYVEIGPSEYGWPVEKQGHYPDVLLPNAPIDVPGDQDAQPFFITVKAGPDTPAGDYAGTVRMEAEDEDGTPYAAYDLPLHVHVWDFAIPERPNFKASLWMNEGFLQRFYKYEGRTPREVRERYYQFHLDHRVSPVKDFPVGGGAMLDDFEYLIAHGQNCFFIPIPGYLEEADRPAHAEALLATRDLLREKGWDPYALFYSLDEVAVMHRPLIPKMVEMNAWIKSVLPEWPRLETSAPEQALFGAVDVWCPTIDSFDPRVLANRMALGDRLWFYTVWGRPGVMIEAPGTDHRIMFWMCYKYGAEGFLYWGTTHWDLNCVDDARWPQKPWIPYNRQPGHNGCGYLIYPGPNGTPLSSIRFELVRDGIEDYEYLNLVRTRLEAAGNNVPEELRQRALREIRIPAELLVDHERYTDDPKVLLMVRARMAEVIEDLGKLTQ